MSLFAVIALWDADLDEESLTRLQAVSKIYVATVGFEGMESTSEDIVVDKRWPSCVMEWDAEAVSRTLLEYEITDLPCVITVDTADDNKTNSWCCSALTTVTASVGTQSEADIKSLIDKGVAAFDSMDLFVAATHFTKASRADAKNTPSLFNLASLCHMMNYPTLAVHYFEAVLHRDRGDMTALKSLWNLAQGEDGRVRRCCVKSYQVLVDRYEDPTARQKLATLTGEGEGASKMDTTYARAIYEDLGDRFETRLVDVLGYRGPWILHDIIVATLPPSVFTNTVDGALVDYNTYTPLTSAVDGVALSPPHPQSATVLPGLGKWHILDLGCGSGLVGRAFGDFIGGPVSQAPPVPSSPSSSECEAVPGGNDGESAAPPSVSISSSSPSSVTAWKSDVLGDLTPLLAAAAAAAAAAASSDGATPMLAGIDISSKMAQITSQTGTYHAVACCDAVEAVRAFEQQQSQHRSLHMVIAADTFIYLGVLGAVFAAAARALISGGLFVFSVEDLERSSMRTNNHTLEASTGAVGSSESGVNNSSGSRSGSGPCMVTGPGGRQHALLDGELVGAVPGWGAQLLTSTRFAHSAEYIETLSVAHGFAVCACRSVTLRREGGVPVYGLMWVLQREM